MLLWITTAMAASLLVRLPAVTQGASIPVEYTCQAEDGNGVSPQIAWASAPAGTESFALIVDDPDAPGATWVHWVVFNIPPTDIGLARDIQPDDKRVVQGINGFGKNAWGGPCPPVGKGAHRYYFRLYALDTTLDLQAGATREAVDAAMKGHVLASGTLMGRFER